MRWLIDQSDFVGKQVESVNILPTLLPYPFHWRPFLQYISCQDWSRQESEHNLLPVIWSLHQYPSLASSHYAMSWMVKGFTGGADIEGLIWSDCQVDFGGFLPPWIEAVSSISPSPIPEAGNAIHQAATANRYWRVRIARPGCRLGEHQECAEPHWECHPDAPSIHARLFSYRVVETLNSTSAQHVEIHKLGMSHMWIDQPWLVLDNSWPRKPTEGNIVFQIYQHSASSSWDQLCQDYWVQTALSQPHYAIPCLYVGTSQGTWDWPNQIPDTIFE